MNRRDTIIIAVLLNAGLLAILFFMAINTDDKINHQSEFSQALVDVTEQSPPSSSQEIVAMTTSDYSSIPSGDEIDNALKQYADNPQLILVDDEGEPAEKEPPSLPPAISTTPPQNPQPVPSTQNPQQLVDVTVKKGDALEKIARANSTTVEEIKVANNLPNSKLKIGQVLKVPVGTKQSSALTASKTSNSSVVKPITVKPPMKADTTSKPKAPIASADQEFYTIKSGDNPWKIAKQFHVKFDELLKLNKLDEEKARNLKVGEKIRVK